ncbi:MAG: xanthine dehydrogenase family protein subunit M [Armatimonadota bacterium]|nr:xanthine dehydrogenase family protein subunit M [Armatimonadota bacterium]MDR7510464.1 xanthine dehydrogenase family protein subunit M [Armatimonadota bacterium]
MKPAAFEYVAPRTLDEALGRLADLGADARPLAGGQSLVPLLNMRLVRPAAIVDLNRIPALFEVRAVDSELRLGAMVRHRTLERHPAIRARAPLLADAAAQVGHVQIRTRGTLGGSLAHADPAAELPAAAVALDARCVLRGPHGERTVPAAEFVVGPLATILEPGELLVEVRVPPLPSGTGWAFVELARRHGDFAIVGAAALIHLDADGRIDLARLALCGVGGVPHAASWVGDVLRGARPDPQTFRHVAARVRDEVEPDDDIHAGAAYRKAIAGVLSARALQDAAERARDAAQAGDPGTNGAEATC